MALFLTDEDIFRFVLAGSFLRISFFCGFDFKGSGLSSEYLSKKVFFTGLSMLKLTLFLFFSDSLCFSGY